MLSIFVLMCVDAIEEKKSRAAYISGIERSISKDTIVIADNLNYIKGLRYQLYCMARAANTPHCAVRVAPLPLWLIFFRFMSCVLLKNVERSTWKPTHIHRLHLKSFLSASRRPTTWPSGIVHFSPLRRLVKSYQRNWTRFVSRYVSRKRRSLLLLQHQL